MTKKEMSKKKLIPSGDITNDSTSDAIPQEDLRRAGPSEQQQPSGLTEGALPQAVGSKYQLTVAQMKEVARFMATKTAVQNRRNGIQQATTSANPFNMPVHNQAGPSTSNNDDATPSAKEGNQMLRVMPIRHDSDKGDDAAEGVNPEQDKDAESREELSKMSPPIPTIEEAARARKEPLSEADGAVETVEKAFTTYFAVHNWLRPLLSENERLMYGVYADDFEKSLIEYYVKYKDQPWHQMKDNVEKNLKRVREQHQDDTPEDKAICQKITYLLDFLHPLILQDVSAIMFLYPNEWQSKLENQYMDLLFNPDRTPLTFNCMSPDVRRENLKILENYMWSQESVKRKLNNYVKRQNYIRVGDNLDKVVFEHPLDKYINHHFFNEKVDFCANLPTMSEYLIQVYKKFWKWQRDMHKQFLKTDQSEAMVLHIHLTEAMVQRSMEDPYTYVLLFDAHQLANLQQQLYGTPTLFQLNEHTKHYFCMIFGMKP